MLHAQNCILCGRENEFYDKGLQVDPEVNTQVVQKLIALHPIKTGSKDAET